MRELMTSVDVIIIMWLCRRKSLFLGSDAEIFRGDISMSTFYFQMVHQRINRKKTRKRRRRGRWDRKEEKKEGQRVEGKGERESEEI